MTWFKRVDHEIVTDDQNTVRTEGLWIRCDACRKPIFRADLEANNNVCPYCGFHFRIGARAVGHRIPAMIGEPRREQAGCAWPLDAAR